jgi:hypothetical protein
MVRDTFIHKRKYIDLEFIMLKHAIVAFLVLSACGGGGGGGGSSSSSPSNDSGTTSPTEQAPASNSTEDLIAFTEGGYTSTYSDVDGVTSKARDYTEDGDLKTVEYSNNGDTGLLIVKGTTSSYELVGADPNGSTGNAYYTGNITGSYRVEGGEEVEIRTGSSVAAAQVDVETGAADMGADMWGTSMTGTNNVNGLGVGASGGVIDGNTVVWNDVAVYEYREDSTIKSDNTLDMNIVYSDDKQSMFGTITGSNDAGDFGVNAGFVGDIYVED